jgi:electron transport complex protein RnfG
MAELNTGSTSSAPAAGTATTSVAMIVTLGVIGMLCAILIVVAYRSTYAAIADNKARYLEQAIFDILPDTASKVAYAVADGTLRPLPAGEQAGIEVYAGYDQDGGLTGIAVPAAGQGFQDIVRILYGYDPDCHCIIGMKVLESRETPGLGTKIETDPVFLKNFAALSVDLTPDGSELAHPITLVKPRQKNNPWEIDAISGATISSRAIADMLHKSTLEMIPVLEKNLPLLESQPSPLPPGEGQGEGTLTNKE